MDELINELFWGGKAKIFINKFFRLTSRSSELHVNQWSARVVIVN